MSSLTDIPSEIKCKQTLYEIVNGGLTTCKCSLKIHWKAKNNYGWCKNCRKQIYPKSSTFLSSSNLSCKQIFQLVWCWQNRHSPGSTKAITGLDYVTIRRWYKRFRQYLPPDPNTELLSGIIEVDEAYFGKRRYGNQIIVIGAIERDTKRLRLQIIPDAEQDSIELFLQHNIERGSLVITDCHSSYSDIEWLGYGHERFNHSIGNFAGTNHIEQVWSAMKRYMRKLYGNIPTRDLHLILNEWEARHNQPELFETPEKFLQITLQR